MSIYFIIVFGLIINLQIFQSYSQDEIYFPGNSASSKFFMHFIIVFISIFSILDMTDDIEVHERHLIQVSTKCPSGEVLDRNGRCRPSIF